MKQLVVRLAVIALCIVAGPAIGHAEKRVALVVGNSNYKHVSALKNPANDARAITTALKRLNFSVLNAVDVGRLAFESKVREFARAVRGADVALLFYAGHGLQVNGRNYLAPIDAKLKDESDLDFETLALETILKQMERGSRTNLIFLDACRDNPLATNLVRSMGTRSAAVGRGLARVDSGVGTLIAFATQPGNVALDGQGTNSPFTEALLQHLETPSLDVAVMMRRVRQRVVSQTSGQQVPWSTSSLTGAFVFASGSVPSDPPKPSPPSLPNKNAVELAFWNSIESSRDPAAYELFLDKYPNSAFASLAKLRHGRLKKNIQPKNLDNDSGLDLAYWNSVKDSKDTAQIQSYLKRFPKGAFIELARFRLDGLTSVVAPPVVPKVDGLPLVPASEIVGRTRGAVVALKVTNAVSSVPTKKSLPTVQSNEEFEKFFKEFFDKKSKGEKTKWPKNSLGSGFIVSSDGYVVTANSVIANADRIEVIFDGNSTAKANLVGRHPDTDLALLKIVGSRTNYPFITFAKRTVVVGEQVLAIGNPYGLLNSVVGGKVVGWDQAGKSFDHIEVDARINRGNSGGPLIDAAGQVVGVNVSMKLDPNSDLHLGYAVTSSVAVEVIRQLKHVGEVTDSAAVNGMKNQVRLISKAPDAQMFSSPDDLKAIARKTRSATVNLTVTKDKIFRNLGFFVSREGHIVTAHHVIDKAKSIVVRDHKGNEFDAEVVGSDPESDLAVLKAKKSGPFQFVRFSNRLPSAGEEVFTTLGAGASLDQPALGIVSALNREFSNSPSGTMQSDIRIRVGDSGAPIFNLDGDVVGVGIALMSPSKKSVGISIAVPAGIANAVVSTIRKSGNIRRGWLGVTVQNVTDDIAESVGLDKPTGAVIASVSEDGPAEKAGTLKAGDIVLEIGGDTLKDSRDLARRVAKYRPNARVDFTVLKNGKRAKVSITLGERPQVTSLPKKDIVTKKGTSLPDKGVKGERVALLKLDLISVSKYSKSASGVKDGVFVVYVGLNTSAAERRLKRGDKILEVGSVPVRWVREVRDLVSAAKRKGLKAVLLLVESGGNKRYVALPF